MAWIKLDHFTPDKPEIIKAASILLIDQDAVLGKCVRLWIWADQQSISGNALSVTKTFLDRLVSHVGFADALQNVGWLDEKNSLFSFPNFDRHNGESAKKRAQTANRVEKHRNAESVTKALPDKSKSKSITTTPAPTRSRERDPIWDIVAMLGWPDGIPKSQQTRVGKLVADLKSIGAAPEKIMEKFEAMRKEDWGKHAPMESLLKNWSTLRKKAHVPSY